MNYIELINDLEDTSYQIPDDCYYHVFDYYDRDFIDMINSGIKSRLLLCDRPGRHNGYFYVSLFKDDFSQYPAFPEFIYEHSFIIRNDLKTIKCHFCDMPKFLRYSFLPIRGSQYENEYQKFLRVDPSYIIGIRFNLLAHVTRYNVPRLDEKNIIEELQILKSMAVSLKSQNIDIPIIDAKTKKVINQQKARSLQL